MDNGDIRCDTCVYHSQNLDRSRDEGKAIAELPEDGCSLDYVPGSESCGEMRASNCSIRKTR